MQHKKIEKMPGSTAKERPLSGYKLSEMVGELTFLKPSLRYPGRIDNLKKAVLRVLCDRYPNVWASVRDIAKKAGCGTTQARRILRELELKDRLIVDINSRYSWRRDSDGKLHLTCDDAGKGGGSPYDTVQYFICDRKIVDIYTRVKFWEERDRELKRKQWQRRDDKDTPTLGDNAAMNPNAGSSAGQHWETPGPQRSETDTPTLGAPTPTLGKPKQGQPPAPRVAEPTILNPPVEPTTSTGEGGGGGMENKQQRENKQLNVLLRMTETYRDKQGSLLTLAGKERIAALVDAHGDEIVLRIWSYWIRRNLDGLACPLIVFAQEFDLTLTAYKKEYGPRPRRYWDEQPRKEPPPQEEPPSEEVKQFLAELRQRLREKEKVLGDPPPQVQ